MTLKQVSFYKTTKEKRYWATTKGMGILKPEQTIVVILWVKKK
jgi:hypothetical protein